MMPKKQYMALSSAAKKKVKARMSGAKSKGGRVKGRGDYTFDTAGGGFKQRKAGEMNAGGVLGDWIGGAVPFIGSRFRKPVSWLGSTIHKGFKAITGQGDYRVRSNNLLTGAKPPSFSSSGRGVMICHREYLGDVLSSSAFAIQSYPINAGLSGTFLWLSTIAGRFEQYCIRGMIFEYRTTSATSLTSSTSIGMGTVMMATEYNSVNPGFVSKAQMENHEYSTSAVPSKTFMHPIECARGETPISCLYVRTGAIVSGSDQRLYDLGNFQIATVGMPTTGDSIGELWVTYDIELLKPSIGTGAPAPPVSSGLSDHFKGNSFAGVTLTNLFGTTPDTQPGSNLGTTPFPHSLTFPVLPYAQQYLLHWVGNVSAAFTVTAVPAITYTGGAVAGPANFALATSYVKSEVGDVCGSNITMVATVTVPASTGPANVSFGPYTGTGGTLQFMDLYVSTLAVAQTEAAGAVVRRPKTVREIESIEKKIESRESKEEKKDASDDDDDEFEEFMRFKRIKLAREAARAAARAEADRLHIEDDAVLISSSPSAEKADKKAQPAPPACTTPGKVASRK